MKSKRIIPTIIGFVLLALEMFSSRFIENQNACLVVNFLLIILALVMFNLVKIIMWIKGEKQEATTPKPILSKPAKILLTASILAGIVIAVILLIIFYL